MPGSLHGLHRHLFGQLGELPWSVPSGNWQEYPAWKWRKWHPPEKNTCCSRSFGKPVMELEELEEAVANYAIRATRKVRLEGSLASGLQVFIMTNRFREDQPQYSNSRILGLDEPTDDPIRIVQNAKKMLRDIYRSGYAYKKAGVILLDLVPSASPPGLCFLKSTGRPRREDFVNAVEEAASRYGGGGAFWGGQGIGKQWRMRREMRTPRYTTHWEDLLEVE